MYTWSIWNVVHVCHLNSAVMCCLFPLFPNSCKHSVSDMKLHLLPISFVLNISTKLPLNQNPTNNKQHQKTGRSFGFQCLSLKSMSVFNLPIMLGCASKSLDPPTWMILRLNIEPFFLAAIKMLYICLYTSLINNFSWNKKQVRSKINIISKTSIPPKNPRWFSTLKI